MGMATFEILAAVRRHWLIVPALVLLLFLAYRGAWNGNWMSVCGYTVAAAGVAMNLLAICANRGRMPVRFRWAPHEQGYAAMNRGTRLRFLGDWIPVGRSLLSPGDVCLFAGIATTVVA